LIAIVNKAEKSLSTRLLRKGALVEETYRAFQSWDTRESFAHNLQQVRSNNTVGAPNSAWLREVLATLSSRFNHGEGYMPLARLARAGFPLDKWRSCLLWHIGQTDGLFYQFATEWLFDEHQRGTYSIRTEAVVPFVSKITNGRLARCHSLSTYGSQRAARDLLLMAKDLGLLTGGVIKHFAPHPLPEEAFLYVVYGLKAREQNARRLIESPDWRLFLMAPDDVERQLLHLHQFRKLHYETAGSLFRLTLPLPSLKEYIDQLSK
jgi:hypothetical protein